MQTVFPLPFKASRTRQKEFAQIVCANRFIWVGDVLGGLPPLAIRKLFLVEWVSERGVFLQPVFSERAPRRTIKVGEE